MPFYLKALLVPSLILGISLAGRRWGPRTAGALVGLPLTSGPVVALPATGCGANRVAWIDPVIRRSSPAAREPFVGSSDGT